MTKHRIVIAGGGPTGLMLAAELALAGVDVALVERRATQELAGSRAGGLHARTLEMFDLRGITDRFLAEGKAMQVGGYAAIPLDISDFPTRRNHGLALFQNHIERILAAWVAELPVTHYRGCEVIDLAQDADSVTVQLDDGKLLHADYLVGCDGGRSVVRKRAGIEFPGWDAANSYLIAEIETAVPPELGMRRTERGINGIGPLDERRVRIVLCETEVRSADEPTLDELRDALTAIYGTDFGVHSPTWLSRFTDASRQAATYRDRRVLLAGDAAHVHAPYGGQGLNIGVQDAMNLGWKLAQVVRGASPESLLDTYHAERHPVAARVLENTMAQSVLNRNDDRTRALRDTVAGLLALDEPRRRIAGMMSGLDVHYDLGAGHPLLGRRMPDLEITVAGTGKYVSSLLHTARPVLLDLSGLTEHTRVWHVRAEYTGAWELPVIGSVTAPSAVLIRPDGYVAWVGEGSDAGLADALALWC